MMVMDLQTPTTNNGETANPADPKQSEPFLEQEEEEDISMIDSSSCSTPYVSAPSSPGRPPVSGFFYSAPASPMHFAAITPAAPSSSSSSSSSVPHSSYEFEFSARFNSTGFGASGSMSSADELFLNGQIRPMKLSTHLERPQVLAPLLDLEEEEDEDVEVFGSSHVARGRDLRLRDKSLRRRTRSLSPLRNTPLEWTENEDDLDVNAKETKNKGSSEIEEHQGGGEEEGDNKMLGLEETTTPSSSVSASSSRSSSAGRSSKRWVFLKDFLRSKSEGRSNNKYFWSTISFSPTNKDKKQPLPQNHQGNETQQKSKGISTRASSSSSSSSKKVAAGKPANGVGKRRVPASPHELHYKAHRAQAEELRKKTFLPYRQGLLGCLGFSSKGYGAINGFARALNPVSSR